MRVLVTGATGYIGGRLVPRLRDAGLQVRCLARAAGRLHGRFGESVEIVEGDLDDSGSLVAALRDCEVAYYLVHSMASSSRFAQVDRETARRFGDAARAAGVKGIVYLGGLGDDGDALSVHLRSRHEVGDVLRESRVPVIEFRAAQIIGSGSISFEMMRYLTERLPLMIAPRWVTTRCQPIGIRDVLAYLIGALSLPRRSRIYEIGGGDVLTYREMMLRYAAIRGLKRQIVVVPFFSPTLSSYWVHLITPIPARLARPLIKGLHNEVVVRDSNAANDFPNIHPLGYDDAVRLALDRSRSGERESTWFDAFAARAPRGDFAGLQEGMLIDRRVGEAAVAPARVAAVFSSLGGTRGWLSSDRLWRIRGWMDRMVGGTGLRRGRRAVNDLRIGDVVDFWRVDAYEPGRFLRLRAEMKVPGRAWLQFEANPKGSNACTLVQTAFFEPRGLWGYLYWYAVAPFHASIFGSMAKRIIDAAGSASVTEVTR
jgi:uncharacterized protein YbjT (DUF2867 family)